MTTTGKRIALCPNCNEPLISTFAFSGYEFYCICCGNRVTFFGPRAGGTEDSRGVGATNESRQKELQAEWDENVGGKLVVRGSYLDDCDKCKMSSKHGDHSQHATDEEWAAHHTAREWLTKRAALTT